ncbi:DUF5703 domain-containing protein [Pedobacter nutrimenti]|uniref:DUF5703 domain-containing protein n=1 Tax=Pedobacter nutrimenti TaxID=1241337 RepID=UPI0029318C5C|nr:DUF5703 domain-containing protein [Pedobacter nutrimenti]
MRITLLNSLLYALFLSLASPCVEAQTKNQSWTSELASYNYSWTTPGKNSSESMPLAGGVLGLNVWVENNDLLFLMGSPNCMDENGMQVKLGLVRLHFSPTVFEKEFRQELNLLRSEMVISGKCTSGAPVKLKLWCAVDKPVIHVEMESGKPVEVTASYETWSKYDSKFVQERLQWVHRLADANARRLSDIKTQGMEQFTKDVPDPLSKLTMGGIMVGSDMEPAGTEVGKFNNLPTKTSSLKTRKPLKKLDLCITLRMEQDSTLNAWEHQLSKAAVISAKQSKNDRKRALIWWQDFWNRSYISINPNAAPTDSAWQVGRNYQLFRYQLAANRDGRAMTLFNGGVFTCTGNPDQRMWDGCQFMGQNQRLVYWPLLKSGDFDLLKVGLDFYKDRTEINRLHTRKFWGIDGVAYPEPYSIFGLDAIGTDKDGRNSTEHLKYHYTSGMEFALMMLETGRFTGQDIKAYLPAVEGIINYYDRFYQKEQIKKSGKPLDENGQLVIYPSDACEPFHGCTNNTDVIAGLWALSKGLLELPSKYLTPQKRLFYENFQKRIPPITISEVDGHQVVAPAKSYEWVFYNGNMDFPNMYVCFPFNYYFLGRGDNGIQLAKNTWDFGAIRPKVQKQSQCWYQSAINLARMGRTGEAQKYIMQKFLHPSLRFPAFWTNPGFCHAPDTDHGGSGMIGLQEMLMQCDGKRILIGAAWPAKWDCNFKLNAPYQTTVEGVVKNGKVTINKVVPASRRADLEVLPLKLN